MTAHGLVILRATIVTVGESLVTIIEPRCSEIRIRYADSWDDVYIYDYRLNSRYFEGYMDDGTHRDIYFNLQSDNDFDWDGYRRRYRYAPTRGMNDDGKRFHASGIFAEIKKEASK